MNNESCYMACKKSATTAVRSVSLCCVTRVVDRGVCQTNYKCVICKERGVRVGITCLCKPLFQYASNDIPRRRSAGINVQVIGDRLLTSTFVSPWVAVAKNICEARGITMPIIY